MVFSAYSKYYNLLYKNKNYANEARYVHELIQKYAAGARSVLDLGCGTGRHDFELAKLGYEVTGVDMSDEMLTEARSRLSSLNSHLLTDDRSPINFISGDIRSVRLNQTFDVVVSLFHVMSYQITNEDLKDAFSTAKAHLNSGGLFLFDCWYGPAVLSDPPVVRVKRLDDEKIEVVRIAEPVMHYNDNIVDVNYQMMISDKSSGEVEQIRETHRMRYLFMPEVAGYLEAKGIRILQAEEWITGKEPDSSTWGVCFVSCS